MNEFPLMKVDKGNKVLFHPHIPKNAEKYVNDTLRSRWIGQGPKVDKFEQDFSTKFCDKNECLAVGSGTDALHLAYMLAGLKKGDEVIAPVFTCTATNIPFLYMGVTIKFADVDINTLNISVEHVEKLITPKTKAIVFVHYGGFPCDLDKLNEIARKNKLVLIEDAAHALGAIYKGNSIGSISDFTMFSFQAIKHLTTGDGGMLAVKDSTLRPLGERLRWFGIDRSSKQKGIWENDIRDIGYKYQMTDISASLGLAALEEFDETLEHRINLFNTYCELLHDNGKIQIIGNQLPENSRHAAWMFTILVDNREALMNKLREFNIESAQVHYRNDRYSIFGGRGTFPNMDYVEDKYLVLPLHTKLDLDDVKYICNVINSGW